MGREEMIAEAGSEQARIYGEGRLVRRYTNIFVREDGAWLLLARHASIIPSDARQRADRSDGAIKATAE